MHIHKQTVVLSAANSSVQAGSITDLVPFHAAVTTFLTAEVLIRDAEAQSHYRNDSWNAVVLAVANEQAHALYRLMRNSQSAKY